MRFVDTSFWYGLRVPRDVHHAMARGLWVASTDPLVTSDLVVGEAWTLFRKRSGHGEAVNFLDRIERSPRLTVRHVDEDIVGDAWRWLRRRDERRYSFVDATSFTLMRRLRIREALAFGGDFAAAGFIEVRP